MAEAAPGKERHYTARLGWLRAAVLGANDGIVSTASLIAGVASAGAAPAEVALAGTAGLVAGAMSMAAGEYVSVSSQSDSEKADLAREKGEHARDFAFEHRELADIYEKRGVAPDLAASVAAQLMAKDALATHAREELGISDLAQARPLQAASSSAAAFTAGAALPLIAALVAPADFIPEVTAAASLTALAALGALAARAGGAPILVAVLRVAFWGAAAMAATALVGRLFGTAIG